MPWLAWAAPTSYLSCLAASVDRRPCLKTWPSRRSLRSATPASLSGRRQLALFLTAPAILSPIIDKPESDSSIRQKQIELLEGKIAYCKHLIATSPDLVMQGKAQTALEDGSNKLIELESTK